MLDITENKKLHCHDIKKYMNLNKLYIIGNGFDLFHGVKSKYGDFREFVKDSNNRLFDELDEYFDSKSLWSDFENTLEYLNTEKIIQDASDFLVPYNVEKWHESYHHDYQFEVQRAIDIVTKELKIEFTDWILSLSIPSNRKINLPENGLYLNFNYTNTLEKIYKVPFKNILYIHSKAINQNSTLIIGHSRRPSKIKSFNNPGEIDDLDSRVAQGNIIIDKYFEETYKNTSEILKANQSFFKKIKNIKEVYILGHSLSQVDIQYFQQIVNSVNNTCIWKISCRGNDQKKQFLKTMLDLGLTKNMIKLSKIDKIL